LISLHLCEEHLGAISTNYALESVALALTPDQEPTP
jgi:hypothetical protein